MAQRTVHCYDIGDLNTAEATLREDDELILHPNTYQLSTYINLNKPGVIIRSSTGNPDDVIIRGAGMNDDAHPRNGLMVENDNITIRDLTVKDIYWNGIQIRGEWDVDNTVISNVRTVNIGERHIKGSKGGSGDMDNVLIENCYMLQTLALSSPHGDLDYVGGIDAMACNNWIVRDCVFEGIRGVNDGGRGAVFLWNGINNATVERNVFINCDRSIAFGNTSGPSDSIVDPWHTEGGIIRNNTIVRGDYIALELCNTKDLKVYNNTVYSADVNYFRTVQIWDESNEGRTTNLDMRNNIIRGQIYDHALGDWSAPAVAAMGNIVDTGGSLVTSSWFVDASGGDLHLTASATAAIDGAQTLPEVFEDIDQYARPAGGGPDFGADEYGNEPLDEPTVEHAVRYLGNGTYGVTFTLCGNDGQQDEFAVTATFEGANGGQVQQLKAILDPGVEEYDVDTEADAASYDGLGTPPYDKDRDSYFLEPFTLSGNFLCSEGANYYQISSDTGGVVGEQAALAYIVCTGDVSFLSLIGRGGEIYTPSGLVEMPLPGDADLNGQVDGGDYTTWADNYQQTDKGWGGADFNGDGVVNGGDYTIWADHFTGGGAAVPEPMTLGLLIAAGGALVASRRRKPG